MRGIPDRSAPSYWCSARRWIYSLDWISGFCGTFRYIRRKWQSVRSSGYSCNCAFYHYHWSWLLACVPILLELSWQGRGTTSISQYSGAKRGNSWVIRKYKTTGWLLLRHFKSDCVVVIVKRVYSCSEPHTAIVSGVLPGDYYTLKISWRNKTLFEDL